MLLGTGLISSLMGPVGFVSSASGVQGGLFDPVRVSAAAADDDLLFDRDEPEDFGLSDSDLDDLDSELKLGDDDLDFDDGKDLLDFDEDEDDSSSTSRLTRSIYGNDGERVPSVEDGRFNLPSLKALTTDQSEVGNGRLPEGYREGVDVPVIPLPESFFDRGLPATWTIRNWAAPNTFSHPLYFQDRMLERHGHERFPMLTPLTSGARFFATIPMLPYLSVISHPCDCQYTLGYYRAGSCAPVMLQRPPYERRAMIAEAAAIAKTAIALP